MTFDPDAAATPNSGIYGLPHSPEQANVVVVPVPFEATTSYGAGTVRGPEAIRAASHQVDLFDLETGRPYEAGIAMLVDPPEVRAWNEQARALAGPIIASGEPGDRRHASALQSVNALCSEMNEWVYRTASDWLAREKLVVTVGGDHSVSFGAIRAHAEKWPGLSVLHVDAHADLRRAYEGFTWSHASIMFNVLERLSQVDKLVQVGLRDLSEAEYQQIQAYNGRIAAFFEPALATERFAGVTWREQVDRIASSLGPRVYLSFDIDGLDPTLCPGTGTPVPGGLSFREACALIEGVVRAGKTIVGLDLTEVAPGPAGGEWDGNVGARLLYKMIGWALKSRATAGR